MSLKCEARIVRTFKKAKSECVWPFFGSEFKTPNPEAEKYPECGGAVTVKVVIEQEPYYGGCDQRLAIQAACSRCKMPFVASVKKLESMVELGEKLDITELLSSAAAVQSA